MGCRRFCRKVSRRRKKLKRQGRNNPSASGNESPLDWFEASSPRQRGRPMLEVLTALAFHTLSRVPLPRISNLNGSYTFLSFRFSRIEAVHPRTSSRRESRRRELLRTELPETLLTNQRETSEGETGSKSCGTPPRRRRPASTNRPCSRLQH